MTGLQRLCIFATAIPMMLVSVNPAFPDSDTATGMSTPSMGTGRGRRGGGKQTKPDQRGKSSGSINGSCNVIESPSNPFPGPCVSIILILNDTNGNEVLKTRTTAQGQFEFTSEQGKTYRIVPGSKYYDVVSPTTAIHGGDKVDVKLRQK